ALTTLIAPIAVLLTFRLGFFLWLDSRLDHRSNGISQPGECRTGWCAKQRWRTRRTLAVVPRATARRYRWCRESTTNAGVIDIGLTIRILWEEIPLGKEENITT